MTVHHRLITRHRAENVAGVPLPGTDGPTLLCTAAIHGNEPTGVAACERVSAALAELPSGAFRGEFVALVGNRRAFDAGVRFIHEDLNRHWTPARFRRAHELAAHHDELAPMLAEDRELVELTAAVRHVIDRARGPAVLLDLHTTSADTRPFLAIEDTLRARRLAVGLPAVTILGLESMLEGLFSHWFSTVGHSAIVCEAGRHDDADACVSRHAAVIWLLMDSLGMLDSGDRSVAGHLQRSRASLASLTTGVPTPLHLVHRHGILEGERFEMRPGYTNFETIAPGEHLADSKRGPVCSPARGRIFMPLYQPQGDDGFMIVRPVTRTFLMLSQAARCAHLERFVRFIPGVRRAPAGVDAFRVARSPLRRPTLIALRVLGYRRLRRAGHAVVAARSPYDLDGSA